MRFAYAVATILVAYIPSAFALPTMHDTSNEVKKEEGMQVRSLDETLAKTIDTLAVEADGMVFSKKELKTFQVVDEINDELSSATDIVKKAKATTKEPKMTKGKNHSKIGTETPKSSKCIKLKGMIKKPNIATNYAFMRVSLQGIDDCSEIKSFFEDNLCIDFNLVECAKSERISVLLQVFSATAESLSVYIEKNEKSLNKLWMKKFDIDKGLEKSKGGQDVQLLFIDDIFSTMTPSSVPSDTPSDEPSDTPSDIPSDQPSETPSDEPSDLPSSFPSTEPEWLLLGADIDGENANDRSGWSVSLSSDGSTVAIGAIFNGGNNGSYSGHVRVYRLDVDPLSQSWKQLGNDIDGENADDFSGWSVSLSSDGNTVAIGAIYNDGINGTNSGHVRVYRLDDNALSPSWKQLGEDIDGENADDASGTAVSLSSDGKTVAIGAYVNDGNGLSNSGHVRVYRLDENSLSQSWKKLGNDIDGENANDYSGIAVSLSSDGKTVAIGAIYNDGNGSRDSGHVRVYRLDENSSPPSWKKLGNDIDGENANDYSGRAVSLSSDGNTVAIGAEKNDGNGSRDSGHVRVYRLDVDPLSPSWKKLGKDIDGQYFRDYSGRAVSLSSDGNTVAIGAEGNDGNGSRDSGHVRVYRLDGDPSSPSWKQLGNDIDGENAYDRSGRAVSLSSDGKTVAIGAFGNDGINGSRSGHVRVYHFSSN